MKKLLSILTIAVMLVANTTMGYAENPKAVQVAVTITHTMSIAIPVPPDPITISPGSTAISSIGVQNDGTGVEETVKLTETIPAGWTSYYQFADTKPAVDDPNWKPAPEISEKIAYNVTKNLWLKLVAPATTSDIALTISLDISAS